MKAIQIIVSFFLVLSVSLVHAQQIGTYNQYGNSTTPFNNAGSFLRPEGEINFMGRQQWVGLPGAPESYRLSGSLPIGTKAIIAGLSMSHDIASIERRTEVIAFAGKSVQLSAKNYLAVSLGLGAGYYKANFSEIDAQDPVFGQDINEASGLLAISALFYNPDRYYLGLSAPRVAFSNIGLSEDDQAELYTPYHFVAGALIGINEDFDVKPAALAAWSKDLGFQTDLSAVFFMKKTLGLGANFRSYGDLAGIAQFYTNRLNLGYSYQFNTSTKPLKRGVKNNTHEITIGYRFGKGNITLL